MTYDEIGVDELQDLLKSNEAKVNDIELELHRMEDEGFRIFDILNNDMKATEELYSGWTGEASEKYINESIGHLEELKKEFASIFEQERTRISAEKTNLNYEREAIEEAIRRLRS